MTIHRIRDGDFLRLVNTSSLAARLTARVTIRFDDGRFRMYPLTDVAATNRALASTDRGPIEGDGEVVRAIVTGTGHGKRGQTWIELAVINQNEETLDILAQDYLYQNHNVFLDANVGPGPEGGAGFKQNSAIASNVTPVDIEHTLSAANALRRIDGFIWYYHCSGDVATRTLRASFRDPGNGLPTGMTSGDNTRVQRWPSAGVLSLTANEEGFIFVNGAEGKAGFATSSDDGTQTIEPTTTQPIPFPYWAPESDVGEIFFDVEVAQAADRHSIYIIREEWINV